MLHAEEAACMDEEMLRNELGFWDHEKIGVELYEDVIRFRPIGEKAIEIPYRSIVSCKRYIRELYVTSKGMIDGTYDTRYIPIEFETKETAEYYYQFILGKIEETAQTKETEEEKDDVFSHTDKPAFYFESAMGLSEGYLSIFPDRAIYSSEVQEKDLEILYIEVKDVKNSFGCIRFELEKRAGMSFQVPKRLFQPVLKYLQDHVEKAHVRQLG